MNVPDNHQILVHNYFDFPYRTNISPVIVIGKGTIHDSIIGDKFIIVRLIITNNIYTFSKVITLIMLCYTLIETANDLVLLSLPVIKLNFTECQLTLNTDQLLIKSLLMLLHIIMHNEEDNVLKRYYPFAPGNENYATSAFLSSNTKCGNFIIIPTKFTKPDSGFIKLPER